MPAESLASRRHQVVAGMPQMQGESAMATEILNDAEADPETAMLAEIVTAAAVMIVNDGTGTVAQVLLQREVVTGVDPDPGRTTGTGTGGNEADPGTEAGAMIVTGAVMTDAMIAALVVAVGRSARSCPRRSRRSWT